MNDFPLIKQLGTKETEESPLPHGIKYQQYELEVDNDTQIVNIPLREAEAFENALQELEHDLDRKELNRILREFRGIRG